MNSKRTWPPAEWTFIEPDEDALARLPAPPEIPDALRESITADNVKRKANRFARDNNRPLPFPEIEAERQEGEK